MPIARALGRLARPLLRGLRRLVRPSAAERDLDDEIQHFFDETVAGYMARGLPADQAARAARWDLGRSPTLRDQLLDAGWESAVSSIVRDIRFGARSLRRDAVFTVVTVVTLACGIGATTAIVAAVTPVLFDRLPYPEPDRVVSVVETSPSADARVPGTFGMFTALGERSRAFDALAVLRPWQPTLSGVRPPERLEGQRVSADYFRVLGVQPALGRAFRRDDDRSGSAKVVVLSDALWQRRFASDPSAIGRVLRLDDQAFTVIGVMPPRFENVLADPAEVWTPLGYELTEGRAWGHHLQTVGRLRRGVDVDAAAADVQAAGQAVVRELRPATYDRDTRFSVVRLQDDLVRGVVPVSAAVLGAVVLLLALAGVNVTNLLLARSAWRRGELAMRLALGASRWRITQQHVVEGAILAVLGGSGGLVFAQLAVRLLTVMAPASLFRLSSVGVDGPALWCGLALTALIGVGSGVLSAASGGGVLRGALAAGSRRSTGARRPVRRALVVVQVALALVLLIGSGLLLRSLGRLLAIDPGFDASGVLTLQVQVSGRRFATPQAVAAHFDRLLDAVRAVPGVTVAGMTSQLPLSGDLDEYGAHFEAEASRPAATFPVFRYAVSPGYLDALGIPLRAGRFVDARDRGGAPRVAVISESLARRRFPTGSPIGARLRIGPMDGEPYTIVGVAGSVRQLTLTADDTDAVYAPAEQWPFPDLARSIVLRTPGDPRSLVSAVQQAIWTVDGDQPIVRVSPMADLVLATAAQRRFVLLVFQGFTLVALALAATGLYGLLAGSVVERRREMGVRAALGASPRAIVSLVVGEGAGLAGIGAIAGLALALWGTRLIGGLLFGVSRFDPVTYVAAAGVLLAVALCASILPAWRAARIDPVSTLRAD